MYCPKCFNNSLHINSRGVMHIIINGKQMDAGRFLFNFEKDKSTFIKDLKVKLEEFFKWYSGFQNIEAITKMEICTNDVSCDSKCSISLNNKFSVVNEAISQKELNIILAKYSEIYGLEIELVS